MRKVSLALIIIIIIIMYRGGQIVIISIENLQNNWKLFQIQIHFLQFFWSELENWNLVQGMQLINNKFSEFQVISCQQLFNTFPPSIPPSLPLSIHSESFLAKLGTWLRGGGFRDNNPEKSRTIWGKN